MRDYQFWVYIIASRSSTLYIGMTNSLFVRVAHHKTGEEFTKKYGCDRLV